MGQARDLLARVGERVPTGRFTNPRDLYFGEGARHEVKNLKGKRTTIVTGAFLQDVEANLKEAGFEVEIFEGQVHFVYKFATAAFSYTASLSWRRSRAMTSRRGATPRSSLTAGEQNGLQPAVQRWCRRREGREPRPGQVQD